MDFPIVTSRYDYVNVFFNNLAPIVVNEFIKRHGQHRIYPSTVLAMAALESGYNLNAITLFGIKGEGKELDTSEYIDNKWIDIKASFKMFPSITASVQGLYDLMQLDRYTPACNCTDWEEECRQIQKCGYATDPDYADKLISIINSYQLTMFNSLDNMLVNKEETPENIVQNESEEITEYTVQSGDNLWNIVKDFYNLTDNSAIATKVDEIATYNNIENPDIIYAGQILKMI